MSIPWAVVRRDLSRIWGCMPWEVDDAPFTEILQELKLAEIEQRVQKEQERKEKRRQRNPGRR